MDALPHGKRAGRGDDRCHFGRAAGLLRLGASGRAVGRLPHGHADAGRHRRRAAGLPDGPGPGCFHNQPITSALVAYRSAADQDTATASSIAAALHRTSGRFVGWQSHAASALQIAVRFPDDGGADEVVAAIGEQILAPSHCQTGRFAPAAAAGAASVDGYTLTLAANPWNIVRTYNLRPAKIRLPLPACLQLRGAHVRADNVYDPLYGSFAGDEGA